METELKVPGNGQGMSSTENMDKEVKVLEEGLRMTNAQSMETDVEGQLMTTTQTIETEVDLNKEDLVSGFKSTVCAQESTRKEPLIKDIKNVHLGITGTVTCNICQRELSDKHKLKSHIETVHKPKDNLMCSICKMKFTSDGCLERHIRVVHLSRKQLTCEVCEKVFKQKKEYKKHVATHTGPECTLCKESFGSIRILMQHRRTNLWP
ncbi:zinc finger and BTB domain-containing protein 24-like [Mercenaria mercenaria]|uniref:zinc finger and BTB domain-containing protein 24-like n=1 Tax=Mercenaria mercenaria TaxID=6596 RepID=UPI00234F4F61|nr:zinc finger and BTB domain-containing protein 24-like [Mercenaria mercenaria]